MKNLILLVLIIISATAFGQVGSKITRIYKGSTKNKKYGVTSRSKSKLILHENSTYDYIHILRDNESKHESKEKGLWNMNGDTLVLKPECEIIGSYFYIVKDKKLFPLDFKNENDWVMK